MHWEQKGTDQDGCTHTGGPQSFALTPQDGIIVVNEGKKPTYQATGVAIHYTQVTVTCPPTLPSYTSAYRLPTGWSRPSCRSMLGPRGSPGPTKGGDITYTWQFHP